MVVAGVEVVERMGLVHRGGQQDSPFVDVRIRMRAPQQRQLRIWFSMHHTFLCARYKDSDVRG